MQVFDETIKDTLESRLIALEEHFAADVIFYYGDISPAAIKPFRDFIEKRVAHEPHRERLTFFVNTPGGSAETVEKMVEVTRFHYGEIYFVVPDMAMSAGTILCMSGNKIFMDYSSSLGPIDPQVFNGEQWVPALGYLDKVEQLLEKARRNQLSNAEFLLLQSLDLAMLSRYEQARDLTITLLKRWLVEHKFRDWNIHANHPDKKGQSVTNAEKVARAEEIARTLGDNKFWHSHERMIGPGTLNDLLRLKIDDYSTDATLRILIRSYNDLLTEYVENRKIEFFLHSLDFFDHA